MKPILLQSIHIKITQSYSILGLLSAVSILCCLILLTLPIASYIKFAMILLIMISTLYFILRDALLVLPWSWQLIDVDSKGQLTLTNQSGQQFQPSLAANCFVHANITILNFKRNGFSLVLSPAILITSKENTDELRRLRVWLRWFRHQDVNQEDLNELETFES